jgi:hypothetical protein
MDWTSFVILYRLSMKTLSEQYKQELMVFIKNFNTDVFVESKSGNISESLQLVSENNGGLTYYELRQFLTILLKQTSNSEVKKIVSNILKTVSKLEIMKVPVPALRKQKSISPKIFK